MKSKYGFGILRGSGGKVVVGMQREGRGRWTVSQLERVAPGGGPSTSLARMLSREAGHVAWMLDDTEARSSVVSLPPLKSAALDRAARGLAARNDGGVPESWLVSCQAAPARGGGNAQDRRQQQVFMLQAARAVVEAQMDDAEQWNVRPSLMLPSYLALDLLYRRHGPERDEHAAWNLVFVGSDASFLCISTRDHVLLTRRLPQDLSQGSDPGEYLGRIATETERSIFFARQTEHSPQVARVIVCGDRTLAPLVVERLQQLDLAPAIYWDIESEFTWNAIEPRADDLLAVAGALAAGEGSPFSLCPRSQRRLMSASVRRRSLVGVGAALAAAVPLLLVGGLMTARVQGEYLDKARVRLRDAEVRAAQADEAYRAQRVLMARESRISAFTADRPDLESVLRRLTALTPPAVVYKSLELQEQGAGVFSLHLEGESVATSGADAQASFVAFMGALRACDFAVMEGEPRRMLIRPGEESDPGERTQFSLDLRLGTKAPAREVSHEAVAAETP